MQQYKVLEKVIELETNIGLRTIYLVDDIDDDAVGTTVEKIHFLNALSAEPIKMVINSPGGCDDMMYYLYDAIMASNAPIITVGSGQVCSAASLILVAGDERYATENCFLMLHKAKAVMTGDDDEVAAQAVVQAKFSDRYWKLISRHTGKPASMWYRKAKNEGESWFSAEEMVKWNLVDGIIQPPRRVLTRLPKSMIKKVIVEDLLDGDEEEEEVEE